MYVCNAAVYELKQGNKTCIIVNSTLIVSVDYLNRSNKTAHTSWTLSKPGPKSTTGFCASKSPNQDWSEIYINASQAIVGFQFLSKPNGQVVLTNVSLTVDIVNGTRFNNPKSPGRVEFVAKLDMLLSNNTECFACHSNLFMPLKPSNKTLTSVGMLQLTRGTIIQAFNVTNGTFSSQVAKCPQDSPTTTNMPPTTSSPSSEPPLLTLTVRSKRTGLPCIRLRSRLQLKVPYLQPGSVGIATVIIGSDSTSTGDCDDSASNETTPTIQTMTVKFFGDWKLTLKFSRTGSSYGLTGLMLDYNLNNTAIFPGAINVGKRLYKSTNQTLVSDVPSNGYYTCQEVGFNLPGPTVPYSPSEIRNIALIGNEFTMQAFRNTRENNTALFVGEQKDCVSDKVNNIVPIVVGASLAALVVIVLVAYLIGRRRAASRPGYQSV